MDYEDYITYLYSDNNRRTFIYRVLSKTPNGWGKLRLIEITDDNTTTDVSGNIITTQNTEIYDPTIHDNTSHYMSMPITFRYSLGVNEDGFKDIYVYRNDGGNPLFAKRLI